MYLAFSAKTTSTGDDIHQDCSPENLHLFLGGVGLVLVTHLDRAKLRRHYEVGLKLTCVWQT